MTDENSLAAWRSIQGVVDDQRRRVYLLIKAHRDGLACWEVEQVTGGLHQSISAAINWLHNEGWIVRVGKNTTPTGRQAWVYQTVAKQNGGR